MLSFNNNLILLYIKRASKSFLIKKELPNKLCISFLFVRVLDLLGHYDILLTSDILTMSLLCLA